VIIDNEEAIVQVPQMKVPPSLIKYLTRKLQVTYLDTLFDESGVQSLTELLADLGGLYRCLP